MIRQALNPGGALVTAEFAVDPGEGERRSGVGRQRARTRLVFGGWGIPVDRTTGALLDVVGAAGFEAGHSVPPGEFLPVRRVLVLIHRPATG